MNWCALAIVGVLCVCIAWVWFINARLKEIMSPDQPTPDERPADLHPFVGWPPNRPPAPMAPELTFYAITTNGSVAEVSMNLHRARARAIELQYRGEGTVRLLELRAVKAIDFMPGERE